MTNDKELIMSHIQDRINKFMKDKNTSVECDSGWYVLILELHESFSRINPNYIVHQVKEKFGGLRFYYSLPPLDENAPESAHDLQEQQYYDMGILLDNYYYFSLATCEVCGRSGKLRSKSHWYKTLCEDCAMRLGYEKAVTYDDYNDWHR